jgi:hypothetical protein
MIRYAVALAFLIGLLPAGAQGQTCVGPGGCTPIAKLDCSVSYPGCDSDAYNSAGNADFTRQNLGAVGPNGETVVRTTLVAQTPSTAEFDTNAWGWIVPSVAQGQCRYHRLRIRFVAPLDWEDESSGRVGVKMVNQGTTGALDGNRFIANVRSDLFPTEDDHDPAHILNRSEQNINGGDTRIDYHQLGADTWYALQWRICSSTTTSSADADQDLWVNNNTFGSPSASAVGGFNWDTTGWGDGATPTVQLDLIAQGPGASNSAIYDIADYEYDDEFDSNWFRADGGGGGGSPTTFARPKFRRAALEALPVEMDRCGREVPVEADNRTVRDLRPCYVPLAAIPAAF